MASPPPVANVDVDVRRGRSFTARAKSPVAIPITTPPTSSAAARRDLADWRDERDGAALFEGLAELDRSARRRRVYARLADAERRHAAAAEARLRAAAVMPPEHRPSWRGVGVALGLGLALGLSRGRGIQAMGTVVGPLGAALATGFLRRLGASSPASAMDAKITEVRSRSGMR